MKIEQQCARRNAAHWPINCDTRSGKSVTDTSSFWRSLNKEIGHPMRQKKKKKLLKFFSSYPVSMYISKCRYTSFVPFYSSSPVIHPRFCVASLQVLWLIGNCNLSAGVSVTLNGCFPPGSPAMPFAADVTLDFIIPASENNNNAPSAPHASFWLLTVTFHFFFLIHFESPGAHRRSPFGRSHRRPGEKRQRFGANVSTPAAQTSPPDG